MGTLSGLKGGFGICRYDVLSDDIQTFPGEEYQGIGQLTGCTQGHKGSF
ncbi:hypothetical protein ES705_23066 [subsurface metagenome]